MKKFASIIVTALVLFVACRSEQAQQGADISIPVSVTDVTRMPIYNTVTVTGTVSPSGTSELFTEAEGRYVLAINPRTGRKYAMGDKVNKGDVLVKLENEEYLLSIRIESRRLDLENANQEHAKLLSLYEKGGVTQREIQNSELSMINSRYDYENALLQLNKLEVVAPFEGVIVELPYFTPGVRVSSGTKVAAIMDYSKLLFQPDFPEKWISTIKSGQLANVTTYNLRGDTLKAVITQVSPAINPATRTFKGMVEVNNHELLMRPGMFVKADVIVDKRDSAIVVEREIIQSRRRGRVVFVVERNTAIERRVNIGIETDTHVEIIDGLEPGEQLVTEGYEMLSNRARVNVRR